MFNHQKVARVRVFADIQNFTLRAHCMHGIPTMQHVQRSVAEKHHVVLDGPSRT